MRVVGYERVSTARQGASGLGIAAQRQAIDGFVAQRGGTLLARFTEVESGRNPDRPELKAALHLAKVTGATLVIAKLDRLSRNAAFLLTLRDSGVKFAAVDLPEANDLTVGIMALVAQQEREAISKRTREALAVAKARGVRLGKAQAARLGIWQGAAEAPWDYRENRWARAAAASPHPGCPIKGNISVGSGERIYHTPWSPSYERTVIDESKGERWFCNEAEAIAAGWRPARSR